MIKISVIIPIFNVEKYIEKCAVSLFEQTLHDIEYIFINDGSTDGSMVALNQVLQRYPQRQNQVTIINFEKNQGLHKAMETAISSVRGEYFIRCDSDDWLERNAYLTLYNAAVTNEADIVEFGYFMAQDDGATVESEYSSPSSISSILIGERAGYLWNRLVKSSLIPSIKKFATGNMWEDLPISLQLLINCNRIIYFNKPLYYYRQRNDSICYQSSGERIFSKWKEAVNNTYVVIDSFGKHCEEYKDEMTFLQLRSMFYLYPLLRKKEYFKQFRNAYPGLPLKVLTNKLIPLKLKIGYSLRYLRIIRK